MLGQTVEPKAIVGRAAPWPSRAGSPIVSRSMQVGRWRIARATADNPSAV